MRIGLISDTRAARANEIPHQVRTAFAGVDLILHAGGINTRAVLDSLAEIAPVKAAGRTTGDRSEGPASAVTEGYGDDRVADQHVIRVDGHTIGLIHELSVTGMSDEVRSGFIERRRKTARPLDVDCEAIFGAPVDIVVFGRTLYEMVEEHDTVLFVNPGSPSYPANLRKLGTVAILELGRGTRSVAIVRLSDVG
ncbi:MAG: metallophosphoesterase family protein [Chloroflexi bacterium]|nr:metallophosphoesterase family protein [Chloroflexota bacterium]